MNPSTRLNHLRFGLAAAFQQQSKTDGIATPGLHHLLPVPIRERLVLLAKLDGADTKTIMRALRISRDDAELSSHHMRFAVHIWKLTLHNTYWNLPERHGWRQQRSLRVERALRQLLWADVAVALIGDGCLRQLSAVPLRRRLILYLLLVEETSWQQIATVMGATNWEIRQAIKDGLRAVGDTCPAN